MMIENQANVSYIWMHGWAMSQYLPYSEFR